MIKLKEEIHFSLILKWIRILLSHVGKGDHGLADGSLDLAFQKGSCLNKDKDEAQLREKEGERKNKCPGKKYLSKYKHLPALSIWAEDDHIEQ